MNRVTVEEMKNMIHQSATVPLNEEEKDRALRFVENAQNLFIAAKALVDEAEGFVDWLKGSSLCELDDEDLSLDDLPAVRNALRGF